MRHQVARWAGIKSAGGNGWVVPTYGGRPRTKEQAESFIRACRAVDGDRYTFKVITLPLELPSFV